MNNRLATASPVPSKLPRLAVYLSEEVKADLQKLADLERRSLSQMALMAIEETIKKAKEEGKIK